MRSPASPARRGEIVTLNAGAALYTNPRGSIGDGIKIAREVSSPQVRRARHKVDEFAAFTRRFVRL